MNTFTQATREKADQAADDRGVTAQTGLARARAGSAGAEQTAHREALNRSPAIQAQVRLGQALNRTPHAVAQAELAQRLSQSASSRPAPATQRQAIDEDDLTQTKRNADAVQREAGERLVDDDALQEKAAPLQMRQAGEGRPALIDGHLTGYRSNLRVVYSPAKAQAPLQAAWRDYVPSWGTVKDTASRGIGGAIGGGTAAYLAGTTGSLLGGVAGVLGGAAGLALGAPAAAAAAGIALGGAAGWQLGSSAASYLGGVAAPYVSGAASYLGNTVSGYLGSAVPVVGGLAGAATGAVIGETAATKVGTRLPVKKSATEVQPPTVGPLIYNRARARRENPRTLLTRAELAGVDRSIAVGMSEADALSLALENHYLPTIAQHGQYAADTSENAALTQILLANPFIQRLLDGRLHRSIGKRKNVALPRGSLALGPRVDRKKTPKAAKDAIELFNELVTVDMARKPVNAVNKNPVTDPISSMAHGGTLNVGRPAPRGTLLHELGHHLEFNLSPLEFASVHNFMMARSKRNRLREVGYGRLAGLPGGSVGYDTEGPAMSGTTASEFVLSAMAERVNLGSGSGADEFIRSRASDPIASYATKVYPDMDTEFISTTIAYFDNPRSAREMVEADPLRVYLFLSLARPADYAAVKRQFDALPVAPGVARRRLDERIHKIQ